VTRRPRRRPEVPREERCRANVWHRDTSRYCGGRRQFKLHYSEARCARRAVEGGYCRQHAAIKAQGVDIFDYRWL
jgi:hypothetical protein